MVISEFNTDNPGIDNLKLFFELERLCAKSKSAGRPKAHNNLNGYKLIVVRGRDKKIVSAYDLREVVLNFRDNGWFAVIGSPAVDNVDVNINGATMQNIYKNQGANNLIPSGDDSPYAAILLHSTSLRELNDLQLKSNEVGAFQPLDVAAYEENLIKRTAVDMVVWGRKVPTNRCQLFDNLFPSDRLPEGKMDLLRDIEKDDPTETRDWSLNRCSDLTDTFRSEYFKYDSPSPGAKNPCNGFFFHSADLVTNLNSLLEDTGTCGAYAGDDPRVVDVGAMKTLMESRSNQPSCSRDRGNGAAVETAVVAMNLSVALSCAGDYGHAPVTVPEHSFENSWIEETNNYFPDKSNPLRHMSVQQWIRVNHNINGMPVSFTCHVCDKYFATGHRADIRKKKAIQTPNGYFSKYNYRNYQEVVQHEDNEVHKTALRADSKNLLDEATKECDAGRALEDEEDELMLPTVRMMRTVYAETISEIAFTKHHTIVEMQQLNGVGLGSHHNGPDAAREITKLISSSFHTTLITNIVTTKKPCSWQFDGTTDTRNIPYLIVYIQTLEDGYPITYFYRLIELKEGEKSENVCIILGNGGKR